MYIVYETKQKKTTQESKTRTRRSRFPLTRTQLRRWHRRHALTTLQWARRRRARHQNVFAFVVFYYPWEEEKNTTTRVFRVICVCLCVGQSNTLNDAFNLCSIHNSRKQRDRGDDRRSQRHCIARRSVVVEHADGAACIAKLNRRLGVDVVKLTHDALKRLKSKNEMQFSPTTVIVVIVGTNVNSQVTIFCCIIIFITTLLTLVAWKTSVQLSFRLC